MKKSSGFTLVEMLVVIGIIVVILAMAMPVFRFITGSRSEESAANQIGATLGRARATAIGLQDAVGVAFYTNSDGRASAVEVSRAKFSEWDQTRNYFRFAYVTRTLPTLTRYFVAKTDITATATKPESDSVHWGECDSNVVDATDASEFLRLPMGVGVQLFCNSNFTNPPNPARLSDGYVSMGAVLFDNAGRLTQRPISFSPFGKIGVDSAITANFPAWKNSASYPLANQYPNNLPLSSSFSISLFSREAFINGGFDSFDPTFSNTAQNAPASYNSTSASKPQSERAEEDWVEQNGTSLIINRYTGTLFREQQ